MMSEEKELCDYLLSSAKVGHGNTRKVVKNIAEAILNAFIIISMDELECDIHQKIVAKTLPKNHCTSGQKAQITLVS